MNSYPVLYSSQVLPEKSGIGKQKGNLQGLITKATSILFRY